MELMNPKTVSHPFRCGLPPPPLRLLGGGRDNTPAKVNRRARILQIRSDFPDISGAAVARRATAALGSNVTPREALHVISAGTSIVAERGGARNAGLSPAARRRFIKTVVGRLDADNYRRGGMSVRQAVLQWNNDNDEKEPLSRTAAHRYLKTAGFIPGVPQRGPFIKILNLEQREAFYDEHRRRSGLWWMRNIVFSDSTMLQYSHKVNRHNEMVYHKPGEFVPATKEKVRERKMRHVYGAMCRYGVVGPVFITGGVTALRYCNEILPKLLAGVQSLYDANNDATPWVWQQDGASAHRADLTQIWLEHSGYHFWSKSQWPGSSPDLSPIEQLWEQLQQSVTPPGTKTLSDANLDRRVVRWFNERHAEMCCTLLQSMPQRLIRLEEKSFEKI